VTPLPSETFLELLDKLGVFFFWVPRVRDHQLGEFFALSFFTFHPREQVTLRGWVFERNVPGAFRRCAFPFSSL